MFCESCGKKIHKDDKFCTSCGYSVARVATETVEDVPIINDDKWWYRLSKVTYVVLHLPLALVLFLVWNSNKPYSYYSSYANEYYHSGSYAEVFWYSVLALAIYVIIVRLIKITFLYIVFAQKPKWKKEFKKFF